MKKLYLLCAILLSFIGCSDDGGSTNIAITIEASGLSDEGKLALNNSATFTASLSGYEGDISTLSYRWTLLNEKGELSDGLNTLPNATIKGNIMFCFGRIVGNEQIIVEAIDANNSIIGTATYDFTIVSSVDPNTPRGCFDQAKIVYTRGSFVYTRNFDGSSEEYLGIGGFSEAVISPNGEWIAQVRWRSDYNMYQMHVFRCDGSTGLIPIETTILIGDENPVFSPDSKTLYFIRGQRREDVPNSYYFNVAGYNLETGDFNFLTSYPEEESARSLTMSPVTGELAFFNQSVGEVFPDGSYTIRTKLMFLQPESGYTTEKSVPEGGYSGLDWSPDGSNLIFQGEIEGQLGIYRINLTDGSQPLLVFADQTANTVGPSHPHYYEGGSRIVFVDRDDGQVSLNLWTIDANGNNKQALMDEPSGNLFLHGVLH